MIEPASHIQSYCTCLNVCQSSSLTYGRGQIDATQHAEVEHGRLEPTFVHKPNVGDRSRHERFHRSHREALNGSRRGEGSERLGLGSPETRDHEQDRCNDVYRSLSDLHGHGIANQARHSDGNDTGALKAEGELLQGDVELLGEGRQRRCEQWADGCVIGSVTWLDQLYV